MPSYSGANLRAFSNGASTRGSITLEVMIALAVFVMLLGSVELLLSGGMSGRLYEASDELALAKASLSAARSAARADFLSLVATSSEVVRNGQTYVFSLAVTDETPCLKTVQVQAGEGSGTTSLSMLVADASEEEAEGEDCEPLPSGSLAGFVPATSASHSGTRARALDALSGSVYIGIDAPPYLLVADEASGAVIPFTNAFSLSAPVNALDAAMVDGRPYVFAALDATSSQFAVIDMQDATAPSAAYFSLAGVDPYGQSPEGYRVKYYSGHAYVSARYTAGPELHIFDVSFPRSSYEAANAELGVTLNDFAVRTETRGGKPVRYMYAASSDKPGELRIYDVTSPDSVSKVSFVDLPEKTATHHPAQSIALLGRDALLGRVSGPNDPDFFIYDVTDPTHPLLIANADPGATVTSIESFGSVAFLGTTKSGKQVQAWSLASTAPSLIASYALQGLGARALDYGDGRVFVAGSGDPFFVTLEDL